MTQEGGGMQCLSSHRGGKQQGLEKQYPCIYINNRYSDIMKAMLDGFANSYVASRYIHGNMGPAKTKILTPGAGANPQQLEVCQWFWH